MRTHAPARRGMMLVEMLAVLVLTTACTLLASQLFAEMFRETQAIQAADRSTALTGHLLDTLRRDAWGASQLQPQPGGATLTVNGRAIRWTVQGDGTVTRTSDGEAPREWRTETPGIALQPRDAEVVIRWPGGGEIRCASQVRLAGGGR